MPLPPTPLDEALAPLLRGWEGKLECARKARQDWKDVADQCQMFYSAAGDFMWKDEYRRRFNSNIPMGQFRVQLQKTFEAVATFVPSLWWDTPDRSCQPRLNPLQLTPEAFGIDPTAVDPMTGFVDPMQIQAMQAFDAAVQQEQQRQTITATQASLMQSWLDYTPDEQPHGGLSEHGLLMTTDSVVTGRGCFCTEPWLVPGSEQIGPDGLPVPGSGRMLTGSFWESPYRFLIDPDATSATNGYWIARECLAPVWKVAKEFGVPVSELQPHTYKSANAKGESYGDSMPAVTETYRPSGDLVRYWKIWSKMGLGTRLTDMANNPNGLAEKLESVVGDYAYVVMVEGMKYPLNCTPIFLETATTEDVARAFQWPIEFWRDRNGWPVKFLDHYPLANSAWPIPPLQAGIPLLILINFVLSRIAEKCWQETRDIWAVDPGMLEDLRKAVTTLESPTFVKTTSNGKTIADYVQQLQMPMVLADVWRILDELLVQFERATGLSELLATGNASGGSQSRSAADARNKAVAAGVRPEYMAQRVKQLQAETARQEAFLAISIITGRDVEPLLGQTGAMLWDQHIAQAETDATMQSLNFTIAASSGRRPDKEKARDDLNVMVPQLLPLLVQVATTTGDWAPVNEIIQQWCQAMEMNGAGLVIQQPPPMPDPMMQQPVPQGSESGPTV